VTAAVLTPEPAPALRFVLVDDAFGPLRLPATAQLTQFANELAAKGHDVAAILAALPGRPATAQELSSADYEALVAASEKDAAINTALRDAGAHPAQQSDKAHKIRDLLEKRFGVGQVDVRPNLENAGEIPEGSIVFLDYRLESVAPNASGDATKNAMDVAERLAKDEHFRFVILMSEQPVAEEQVAEFCRKAEILRGSFEFIKKEDLVDEWRLAYMLDALRAALPEIRTLRDLLMGLETRVKDAAKSAMLDLRAIPMSDWATCRAASLREDGQRFSEYVLWLFTERLSADLEGWKNTSIEYDPLDAFLKERSALQVTALSMSGRSGHGLIRAYSRASFIPADQLRAVHGDGKAQLAFGDVLGPANSFRTPGAQVRVVITPDCDLFDRIHRHPDGKEGVVMVEGTVRAVETLKTDTEHVAKQTKTFAREVSGSEQVVVIDWFPERVSCAPHNSFDPDPHPQGLVRLGRVRQVFASELKDDFVRTITRTGVMIRPPHLAEQTVRIHARGLEHKDIDGGAVVVRARGDKYAALTRRGVEFVHDAIVDLAEKGTDDPTSLASVAAKVASELLKSPEALSDLHTLAQKKKTVYNYPSARDVLKDAVQIREGDENVESKHGKPLQAEIEPPAIREAVGADDQAKDGQAAQNSNPE
jgi:hypothetical protein